MAKSFIGRLTPRDTALQLQRIARHTLWVVWSKYALVGIAFLLVSLVFIIPGMQDDTGGARIVFTNLQEGEALPPKMSKPRYQGTDDRNQPYVVTADSAEQRDDGTVLLEKIEADITLANGNWLAFMAKNGIVTPHKNTLFFPETVSAFYDDGYEMHTSSVNVNLRATRAIGKEHVKAQGPLGSLDADGFVLNTEKKRLIFTGNVKVVLNPKAQEKSKGKSK